MALRLVISVLLQTYYDLGCFVSFWPLLAVKSYYQGLKMVENEPEFENYLLSFEICVLKYSLHKMRLIK